uniref:Uncharacterized protein n=1 Tax=Amphimedon queenslandica TaxID=400682 RepID=A0A1X7VE52_AMPQE
MEPDLTRELTRELLRKLLEEKDCDIGQVGCCCGHMNPHLYVANYKVHLKQNEELSMFGVTHIMAIDRYSGKIVSLVTMPLKNCSLIYEHVYMKLVEEFSLCDQISVDYGTEWALILHVKNLLSEHRNDPLSHTICTDIVPS